MDMFAADPLVEEKRVEEERFASAYLPGEIAEPFPEEAFAEEIFAEEEPPAPPVSLPGAVPVPPAGGGRRGGTPARHTSGERGAAVVEPPPHAAGGCRCHRTRCGRHWLLYVARHSRRYCAAAGGCRRRSANAAGAVGGAGACADDTGGTVDPSEIRGAAPGSAIATAVGIARWGRGERGVGVGSRGAERSRPAAVRLCRERARRQSRIVQCRPAGCRLCFAGGGGDARVSPRTIAAARRNPDRHSRSGGWRFPCPTQAVCSAASRYAG